MESVKKNYIFQVSYQILNMLLPFVTSPYISRILGAENLGIYSYTYSVANIFILFINLGIEKYGSRMIAAAKENKNFLNKVFSELLILKIILGILVTVLYLIINHFILKYKLLFGIQTFLLLGATIDINWFFWGIEKFKITVIRNFVFKLCTVLCIFLFVRAKDDLWIYITIMALGTLISQSLVWFVLRQYVCIKRVKCSDSLVHLKPLMILFTGILAQSAYTYIDKIMLGSLGSMEQLGFCDNAYKIVSFPMGMITSLGVVMLPRMTMLYNNHSIEKASKYISSSMHFVLVLAFGMAGGMAAIGEDFSIVFLGESFATSGRIVAVISPIVLFMSWSDVVRNQYLIPKGLDKEYTTAIIIGAIINVVSNALLIPKIGAFGAAIGTVLSYFSIAVYQTYVTRKELPYRQFIQLIIPLFLFSMIMFFCVNAFGKWYENISVIGIIIQVCIGIVVYGTLVLVYLFLCSKAKGEH